MAVMNGERFLDDQILSIHGDSWPSIDLVVSDDGSTDRSREILARHSEHWCKGILSVIEGPRVGFAANFRHLILNFGGPADFVAFSDQDDIWDTDKLSTAIHSLREVGDGRPALHCGRTRTIDEDGRFVGLSPAFRRRPSFENAMVQSIAGGNTMVLNRPAFDIVREASARTSFVSHDWWCYQIVTGVGGEVRYSPEPKIAYRQHAGNLVGANNSWRARMFRLNFMMEGRFQKWNEQNIAALRFCQDLLTPQSVRVLDRFSDARNGNTIERLLALWQSQVYRQTIKGQFGLYAASALGRL